MLKLEQRLIFYGELAAVRRSGYHKMNQVGGLMQAILGRTSTIQIASCIVMITGVNLRILRTVSRNEKQTRTTNQLLAREQYGMTCLMKKQSSSKPREKLRESSPESMTMKTMIQTESETERMMIQTVTLITAY